MITGILVALPDELITLTKTKIAQGHCVFIADRILVIVSGIGPKNAANATTELIEKGAEKIISWGCAAALDENLQPGDLTLANQLISETGDKLYVTQDWLQETSRLLAGHVEIHTGSLVESSIIVASSEQKMALRKQTSARVLDMESYACATIAKQASLPFLAIRVIADSVNMNLPQAITQAMDADGNLVLSRLLYMLLVNPAQIPELIKLENYFRTAKNKLKLVAKHLGSIVDWDQQGALYH